MESGIAYFDTLAVVFEWCAARFDGAVDGLSQL
jgi:hypothetical protein